jgi:hypothetical protein
LGTAIDKIAAHDVLLMYERHIQSMNDYKKTKGWVNTWQELTTNSACILLGHERQSFQIKESSWFEGETCFLVRAQNKGYPQDMRQGNNSDEQVPQKTKMVSNNSDEQVPTVPKNTKGQPKKKADMTYNELLQQMSDEEKAFAASTTGAHKSNRKFSVPEFESVFKVQMSKVNDGIWRLKCSCNFDLRYGGICLHKFHVHRKWLHPLGVKTWNYRQVSFIHWAQYSYLTSKKDNALSEEEAMQLHKFQLMDPCQSLGTVVEFTKVVPLDVPHFGKIVEEKYPENSVTSMSLEKMMTSDAYSLCRNYSKSECYNAVKTMLKTGSSSLNTSKYQMELSQGEAYNDGNKPDDGDDGIGQFGVLFDFDIGNDNERYWL